MVAGVDEELQVRSELLVAVIMEALAVRLRRFWIVVALTPQRRARALTLS